MTEAQISIHKDSATKLWHICSSHLGVYADGETPQEAIHKFAYALQKWMDELNKYTEEELDYYVIMKDFLNQ